MNKTITGIAVVVVLLILFGGYLGRHKIKSLLGMTPTPAPVVTPVTPSATPEVTPEASAAASVMTKTVSGKGNILVDSKGLTLYTYDKDTAGKSNCTGQCLTNWPAFSAPSATVASLPEKITVINRSDGSYQYAYNGKPLYYYVKDTKTGDVTGDNVGGVWHVIKS